MVVLIQALFQPARRADTLYKPVGGYDAIAGFVDTAFHA
jgi:hypothetical protein